MLRDKENKAAKVPVEKDSEKPAKNPIEAYKDKMKKIKS
jgi:hypothetical protein